MLVTHLNLSFIWALIQRDRHCLKCNFRHVVNYGFEFCGARRLNGNMGNILCARTIGSTREQSERTDGRLWRTSRVEWSLPAPRKYLMNCLEAGWVSLGAEVTQSEGPDESVWCHSCYQTVHPPTKKAFKHISSTKSKPHCLTSIKAIRNSQRRKQSTFNCQHELIHGLFFLSLVQRLPLHGLRWGLMFIRAYYLNVEGAPLKNAGNENVVKSLF